MMEQFYVHLFSVDVKTPHFLCSQLPEVLQLTGSWEVALCQLCLPKLKSKTNVLFIFSDICVDSIVGDERLPIIRWTPVPRRGFVEVLQLQYVPVRWQQLSNILVQVNSDIRDEASFDGGTSFCTLHFHKVSQ